MRQAIVTKYLGPTNMRGSRVVATCQAGSLTVGWDHALDAPANHTAAARELAEHMGWHGTWVGGAMPGAGYCYVMLRGAPLAMDGADFTVTRTSGPAPVSSGKRIAGWRRAK